MSRCLKGIGSSIVPTYVVIEGEDLGKNLVHLQSV